jgi:hypothetical protein
MMQRGPAPHRRGRYPNNDRANSRDPAEGAHVVEAARCAARHVLRHKYSRTAAAALWCYMDAETQPCPFCGELIRVAARACSHCGHDLNDTPSARGGTTPPDTAAWLELFRQPERVTLVTEPLIKPLRYRRSLREILATEPRTIGEAIQGIANILNLHTESHHQAIRVIVKALGIEAAWALALQVKPLPLRRRRRAFLERVRR